MGEFTEVERRSFGLPRILPEMRSLAPAMLVLLLACGSTRDAVAAQRTVAFFNGIELTVPAGTCMSVRAQADFNIVDFRSGDTLIAQAYIGTAGNFPSDDCANGRTTKSVVSSKDDVVLVRHDVSDAQCREVGFLTMKSDGTSWSGFLLHVWFPNSAAAETQAVKDLLQSVRLGSTRADNMLPPAVRCER